jgi:hypothetical protein
MASRPNFQIYASASLSEASQPHRLCISLAVSALSKSYGVSVLFSASHAARCVAHQQPRSATGQQRSRSNAAKSLNP